MNTPLITRATARAGLPLSAAGGLPPRRDEPAPTPRPVTRAMPHNISPELGRILQPHTAYRWTLPYLASLTPQYIETILRGAMSGAHLQQWELFDLILDTSPEAAACTQEFIEGVLRKKFIVEPYREEDAEPSPTAIQKMKVVSTALRNMRPDATLDENDLEGTLKDILSARFFGQTVLEIDWFTTDGRMNSVPCAGVGDIFAPRATFWVHPVCYAWSQSGRLGLRVELNALRGATQRSLRGKTRWDDSRDTALATLGPMNAWSALPADVQPFPEHKFLVAIHKTRSGSPLAGALLRPLAWWWCMANFSGDWLARNAELWGQPFRKAKYASGTSQEVIALAADMLQRMGSNPYALLPDSVDLELIEASKTGENSPQAYLIELAERQIRKLILRQTMSGSSGTTGKGGGQAFGAVESEIKSDAIDAGGKAACQVLNAQLIPSLLQLNFGNTEEAPTCRLLEDEEGGLEDAQRDQALSSLVDMGENYLRKKYGVPKPIPGEKIAGKETGAASVKPPPAVGAGPAETDDPVLRRQIAYATWKKQFEQGATENPPPAGGTPEREADLQAALEAAAEGGEGVWRTINGTPVFIKDGESVDAAVSRTFKGKTGEKSRRKTSTPAAKKDTLKGPNEHTARASADPADGGRHEEGKGRITTDVIGRTAGADVGDDRERLAASYATQKAELEKLHAAGEVIVKPSPARRVGEGGEHVVELNEDGSRVIKHTKGEFGFALHGNDAPFGSYVELRQATPAEYVERVHLHNQVFGDDTRIEGVSKVRGDAVGLAVSQRAIKGIEPSLTEAHDYMKSRGFVRVANEAIANDHLENRSSVWFHPGSGIIATDVKPDNFKKMASGAIVSVDTIVQHAKPGSALERAMKFGTRKGLAASTPDLEGAALSTLDSRPSADFAAAIAAKIDPVAQLLGRITEIKDDNLLLAALGDFYKAADSVTAAVTADVSRAQHALEQVTAAAFADGLQGKPPKP